MKMIVRASPHPGVCRPGAGGPGPGAGPADDAVKQATLVDQEDQRIMQIRSVPAAILQNGGPTTTALKQPRVFGSSHGRTLVLSPSASGRPHTVADLRRIGGKYFQKLPDGSFLLGRAPVRRGQRGAGAERPVRAAEAAAGAERAGQPGQRRRPGDIQIEEPGGTATHVPSADLVTGSIENSVIMHRFAENATIADTTVTGSRGDGVVLSRATEKVRATNSVAERNGHNGFTLNGQAWPRAHRRPVSRWKASATAR